MLFIVNLIEQAHQKVKSGADSPRYHKDIKLMGVEDFETGVSDNHTIYFGGNKYHQESPPQYDQLPISEYTNIKLFDSYLKEHQQDATYYNTFYKHCAETGIEKWIARLDTMTCTYYGKQGNEILVEQIPN